MSWRDRYLTASFRGVEFQVKQHGASYGRRQVIYEYPNRDRPSTEDLGRRGREFSLDAYVIGEDYDLQRDRLIDACEAAGSGELVHPYLGHMDVVCNSLSVSEDTDEMRMARFTLTFAESGVDAYPTTEKSGVEAVTLAAQDTTTAATDRFASQWTVDGMPAFVTDAGIASVKSLSAFFDGLTVNAQGPAQTFAAFLGDVAQLKDQAVELVMQPSTLASHVLDLIGQVRDAYGDLAATVLGALHRQHSAPAPDSFVGTPSRQQVATNAARFGGLVRLIALPELCKDAVTRADDPSVDGFGTQEDAVAARDTLIDTIDDEMEAIGLDDASYVALAQLRADVVQSLPSPSFQLPRLMHYTPPATTPSLMIAQHLYGDSGRATEIVARNGLAYPGFVPGGTPLQVIADGG